MTGLERNKAKLSRKPRNRDRFGEKQGKAVKKTSELRQNWRIRRKAICIHIF
ncbi:hypothetical protein J7E32_08960 [Bacillus sp. ISL-55]|nr:hypothetical protein [Bacillus sp. ISL-55]